MPNLTLIFKDVIDEVNKLEGYMNEEIAKVEAVGDNILVDTFKTYKMAVHAIGLVSLIVWVIIYQPWTIAASLAAAALAATPINISSFIPAIIEIILKAIVIIASTFINKQRIHDDVEAEVKVKVDKELDVIQS